MTYRDQVVEEPGVDDFGECVPREHGLLHVEFHLDRLSLAAPLAVHDPSRQFVPQHFRVDSQQERRKGKNCTNTWTTFSWLRLKFSQVLNVYLSQKQIILNIKSN